jgi:hypothetical protein
LSYPLYGHTLGILISSLPTPPKTVLNIKEFPNAIIIRKIIPIGLLNVNIIDLLNKRKNSKKIDVFRFYLKMVNVFSKLMFSKF